LFPITGRSARILAFARALSSLGHNTTIITFKETPTSPLAEEYDGVRVRRLSGVLPVGSRLSRKTVRGEARLVSGFSFMRMLKALRLLPELIDMLRSIHPDIVHCVHYPSSMIGLLLRDLIRCPIVVDIQEVAVPVAFKSPGKRGLYVRGLILELLACSWPDAITVPSPSLKRYLERAYHLRGDKIAVVPNCVDIHELEPTRPRDIVREELGIGDDDFVVMYFGTPYPENIEAMKLVENLSIRLNKLGFNVKALIAGMIGEGPSPHPSIIRLGYVPDLSTYIHAADAAILPVYVILGVSSRVVLCLACGLPVVTSKYTLLGSPYLAGHRCVIVANSPEEIMEAVVRLMRMEPSEREALREEARDIARRYFSPGEVARRLEALYTSILASRGKR